MNACKVHAHVGLLVMTVLVAIAEPVTAQSGDLARSKPRITGMILDEQGQWRPPSRTEALEALTPGTLTLE